MNPNARDKLIRLLASIVKTPMDERERRDHLASKCLLFHIFEDDAAFESDSLTVWQDTIWAEVMKQTGCRSWSEIMEDVKTMPSMMKH